MLRQGQRLQVLSPAYSPANPGEHRHEATTGALYLMMGRGLERLQVWLLFVIFLIPFAVDKIQLHAYEERRPEPWSKNSMSLV